MKSNYVLVREFLINRINDLTEAETEFKKQNIKFSAFLDGSKHAYEMVLDLMDLLEPPYDGLKEALNVIDKYLYEEEEE